MWRRNYSLQSLWRNIYRPIKLENPSDVHLRNTNNKHTLSTNIVCCVNVKRLQLFMYWSEKMWKEKNWLWSHTVSQFSFNTLIRMQFLGGSIKDYYNLLKSVFTVHNSFPGLKPSFSVDLFLLFYLKKKQQQVWQLKNNLWQKYNFKINKLIILYM